MSLRSQVDGGADPARRLMPLDPLQLFSPDEVAERLSLSRTEFYRLKNAGRIRTVKVGKLLRVSATALADFIDSLEVDVDDK